VQADLPHTFGTLLIPRASVLVVWGIFLVERTAATQRPSQRAYLDDVRITL